MRSWRHHMEELLCWFFFYFIFSYVMFCSIVSIMISWWLGSSLWSNEEQFHHNQKTKRSEQWKKENIVIKMSIDWIARIPNTTCSFGCCCCCCFIFSFWPAILNSSNFVNSEGMHVCHCGWVSTVCMCLCSYWENDFPLALLITLNDSACVCR